MPDEKATLNFDIPKDLYDQVHAESTRLGISKADFCRMRLIEYFDKKGGTNDNSKQSEPVNPGIAN